jgi:predicted nucleic acid-binding protein
MREVPSHFLTYRIMERYADIRRHLRRQGPGLIGDVDTLIAATGLVRGPTVVTTDRDFERVPDLGVMLIPRQSLSTP